MNPLYNIFDCKKRIHSIHRTSLSLFIYLSLKIGSLDELGDIDLNFDADEYSYYCASEKVLVHRARPLVLK